MRPAPQDAYWFRSADELGSAVQIEHHFGVEMRCFKDRAANVDAIFRASAARRGAHEALAVGDRRITYRDLDAMVEASAAHLQLRGIARGERVVLLLGNRPEFLVLVLACARIGAVSVPVGTRQVRDEVRYVVQNCGAVALFHEADLMAAMPATAETPTVRLLVALAGADGGPQWQPFLAQGTAPAPQFGGEEETAVLLYTSGTTGRPKGAMLTNLGLVHSVMHFARCYQLDDETRTMLAVPCSHVTGLVSLLLSTLYVGGTTVLMPTFRARDFLVLAERERITYTLMVPAMYLLCLRDELLPQFRLETWRVGGFGGSPMPRVAIEQLAARLPRLRLQNAYGATETTSPTSLMPGNSGLTHPDSVGQVVPCGEVCIVDEQGREVSPGETGELWIRGPMVVPGYWENPDANALGFDRGFWKSGDVGSRDADGFVRVFDRLKDMINRGGYKVFSAEVEDVLAQHPHVLESAVVGFPCPVLHERVRAIVYTTAPDAAADKLRAFCAERLADYKVPEFIELRREPLPRNANGKIQKNQLRALPS